MRTLKNLPLKQSIIHGKYNISLGQRRHNPNKKRLAQRPKAVSDGTISINSNNLTPLVSDIKSSNGVYTTRLGKSLFYVKPQAEENMQVMNSKGEMEYLRDGIRNDRLYEREALSANISEALGLDIIPPTRISKDQHGGVGSIQLSAHKFAGKDNLIFGKDITWEHILKGIDEGNGMDLAVLDYITGNTDRNASNFFIDPDTSNFIAIDNGLSFPWHNMGSMSSDYYKTMETIWKPLFTSKTARMSDELMSSLFDSESVKKVEKLIDDSNLDIVQKIGAKSRMRRIQDQIKKSETGEFDSLDFIEAVAEDVKGMAIGIKLKKSWGEEVSPKDLRFLKRFDEHVQNGVKSRSDPSIRRRLFGVK